MPKLKKLIILLLAVLFLVKSASSVQALNQPEFEEIVGINNPNYTAEDAGFDFLKNITLGVGIMTSGAMTDELGPEAKGGAIGQVNSLIAQMVANPPVSTTEYLADLGSNLGLSIKPVYAQGIGWKALNPVLKVWKAFRNIAYMAFIIIFIVVGFMIMFRAKINPQTVITIQAALPKIIITLLLVTFSYAIAGLMIDLIYIGIYLIVGVLDLGGVLTESQPALDILFSKNPFSIVFMKDGADIFIQGPGNAIQGMIEGFVGTWGEETLGGGIVGGLAKLVIGIAILFKLFQLFFSLLLSYLGIVIGVIFAPFNILFNALPGSNSFIGWLKSLFSNVIVFPVVAGMFLLAAILIGPRNNDACGPDNFDNRWCVAEDVGYYPQTKSPGGEVWVPPFLSLGQEGGAGSVNSFQALIALGIIMMTPTIVSQIKKMLKVEPSGFGGAIVGGMMAGPQFMAAVPQTAWNLTYQYGYMRSMFDKKRGTPHASVPSPTPEETKA